MSDAKPFNPTWLTVAAIVMTGVITTSVNIAVNSRDVGDVRARQDATDARVTTIERRLSDDKLATREALVGLQKDMDRANKTLDGLDQALRVAGFSNLKVSSSPIP